MTTYPSIRAKPFDAADLEALTDSALLSLYQKVCVPNYWRAMVDKCRQRKDKQMTTVEWLNAVGRYNEVHAELSPRILRGIPRWLDADEQPPELP